MGLDKTGSKGMDKNKISYPSPNHGTTFFLEYKNTLSIFQHKKYYLSRIEFCLVVYYYVQYLLFCKLNASLRNELIESISNFVNHAISSTLQNMWDIIRIKTTKTTRQYHKQIVIIISSTYLYFITRYEKRKIAK